MVRLRWRLASVLVLPAGLVGAASTQAGVAPVSEPAAQLAGDDTARTPGPAPDLATGPPPAARERRGDREPLPLPGQPLRPECFPIATTAPTVPPPVPLPEA